MTDTLARARGFAIAIPGPGEPDLRDQLLAGQLAAKAEDLTGRDMTLEPQPSGRSVSSAFAFARCRAALARLPHDVMSHQRRRPARDSSKNAQRH